MATLVDATIHSSGRKLVKRQDGEITKYYYNILITPEQLEKLVDMDFDETYVLDIETNKGLRNSFTFSSNKDFNVERGNLVNINFFISDGWFVAKEISIVSKHSDVEILKVEEIII